MPHPPLIEDLHTHPECIPILANWHFAQWGPLTGAATREEYAGRLEDAVSSRGLPSVLLAFAAGRLIGSVSLVSNDMSIRPSLTPWLAQLLVAPSDRRSGVGAALVRAAASRAQGLGFRRLYLYTSGDLPRYYARLGWAAGERVDYLGKPRTLMHYELGAHE